MKKFIILLLLISSFFTQRQWTYANNLTNTPDISKRLVNDVGTLQILAPIGNVDSTANSIIPQAVVRNYGDVNADSFQVIFTISGQAVWVDTQMVRNLEAGGQRTVNFSPWTIRPVGTYTTKCSTAWNLDMNTSNDSRTSQFWVQRCDIGVDSIIWPFGVVDSGSIVPICASVANFGTSTKSFLTIFRIGNFYTDTVSVTLMYGTDSVIAFDNWLVIQPEATYPVKCTVVIANDINPDNNQDTGLVRIRVIDSAVDSILYPTQVIPPGTMTPVARVYNYGGDSASFFVYFWILRLSNDSLVYLDSSYIYQLVPDSSLTVNFPYWSAVSGIYLARCSLYLFVDMNPTNDTMSLIFTVRPIQGIDESTYAHTQPKNFNLENSTPNPFISQTLIRYAIPKDEQISLMIYNSSGILIRKLKAGTEKAGFFRVIWDGCDEQGKRVPEGVYFYRLEACEFIAIKKMVKME